MSLFISDETSSSVSDSVSAHTCHDESSASSHAQKKADLAGPGIGSYEELEEILPGDYNPLLTPKETQQAIFHIRRYIEDNLCKELGLMMVQVPLIVDSESGVNDMLDRDGSRTPIPFHISNDHNQHPIDAQVVQAATKWKRLALKQFECRESPTTRPRPAGVSGLPMSRGSLLYFLRNHLGRRDCDVHGFRKSFTNWAYAS